MKRSCLFHILILICGFACWCCTSTFLFARDNPKRPSIYDCWALEPFVKGNSLYANVKGPENLPVKCEIRLIVDLYGKFSYTVAEMVNGQKVNSEKEEYVYAEGRHMDFSLNAGTGDETVVIQKGLVNIGIKYLKSICEKVDFPSDQEASRWNAKGTKEKYTPKPTTYARVQILVLNSEFSDSFLKLECESKQLLAYLEEKGIEATLRML